MLKQVIVDTLWPRFRLRWSLGVRKIHTAACMELVLFIIEDPATSISDTYTKTRCCSLSIKMLLKIYFALTEISIWFIFKAIIRKSGRFNVLNIIWSLLVFQAPLVARAFCWHSAALSSQVSPSLWISRSSKLLKKISVNLGSISSRFVNPNRIPKTAGNQA